MIDLDIAALCGVLNVYGHRALATSLFQSWSKGQRWRVHLRALFFPKKIKDEIRAAAQVSKVVVTA